MPLEKTAGNLNFSRLPRQVKALVTCKVDGLHVISRRTAPSTALTGASRQVSWKVTDESMEGMWEAEKICHLVTLQPEAQRRVGNVDG